MRNPSGYGSITKMSGKRRRPWRIRVTTGWEVNDKTGREKQISVTIGYAATKKEAMQMLADYNKRPFDLAHKDITFAEVYQTWSKKHFEKYPSVARNVSSAYRKYCTSLCDMRIVDIRLAHLQAAIDEANGKSVSIHTNLKTIFHAVFKYCVQNDIVHKDYSKFVVTTPTAPRKSADERFFTQEQIALVLQHHTADEFFVDIVKFLFYTGTRIGELLALEISDINLEERMIRLRGTKTEAADRLVPIHRDIIPLLEARLGNNKYLIEADGEPLSYMRFRNRWVGFMKDLGISHTPHATRHTFISIMDNCNANRVAVKRIVGHSNRNDITLHYTHKDKAQLLEAIDKFVLIEP